MTNAPYPGPRDTDTPANPVTEETPDPRQTPETPAEPAAPAPGQDGADDGGNVDGDGAEPADSGK